MQIQFYTVPKTVLYHAIVPIFFQGRSSLCIERRSITDFLSYGNSSSSRQRKTIADPL